MKVNTTNYRIMVGSLHYLVNTHPDLGYSIGYVSRFMEAPKQEHLVAGTRGWGHPDLAYLDT